MGLLIVVITDLNRRDLEGFVKTFCARKIVRILLIRDDACALDSSRRFLN